MDSNNNAYIMEALKLQPLSEEEKAARHILGRLYGPIATCKEKTRNGRGYNEELWTKALADDIFKEKIGNKSLFLELGHPTDREETDMRCVCACIPEMPKIINGDLYAYVDILDTDNGRLLKTLCDYGFIPGISSRGSGDVMDNNEVDPETFFLETWDIVQLPAVKKARLSVCESLDKNVTKFNKALCESYLAADKAGKTAIKEACENLGINTDELEMTEEFNELKEGMSLDDFKELTELAKARGITKMAELKDYMDKNKLASADDALGKLRLDVKATSESLNEAGDLLPGGTPKNIADIPEAPDYALMEDTDEDLPEADEPIEDTPEETAAEETSEEDVAEEEPTEDTEVDEKDAEGEEEAANTIKAMIDTFKEYDDDTVIEYAPIKIGEQEVPVVGMSIDDSEDGKILIELICDEVAVEDNKDEEEEANADEQPEAEDNEAGVAEDAADDNGAGEEEVVESVKELVRQNAVLEATIKDLKSEKAVGDAKVEELNEELSKYKDAFMRTSKVAATAPNLRQKVEELTAKVNEQNTTISTLNESLESAKAEAAKQAESKVKSLNEALATANATAEETQTELQSKLSKYSRYAKEQNRIAESYKAKCNALLERYVSSKASMLGVRPSDITSKLNENYTLDDIDAVCDKLLTESKPMFSLGSNRRVTAKINESVTSKTASKNAYNPDNGYEVDDSLLELAGLK